MRNDEPTYFDYLGHDGLIGEVLRTIMACDPPYVLGVRGSWGSGKTSFMRKLHASLDDDGKCERDGEAKEYAAYRDRKKALVKTLPEGVQKLKWYPIWFNPWQHQFEQSPLVALLQEIRSHLSLTRKGWAEAKKLGNVATVTMLGMLPEFAKSMHVPIGGSVSSIEERGRAYEAEHFATVLSSQRFREFFEEAITQVVGKDGRMVIFIDDLDRCEGETAYRLLEALKLYLAARNCVYVLGMDADHLETGVARVLCGKPECDPYRPLARNYLNKMFQNVFLLPTPQTMAEYARKLLNPLDLEFRDFLVSRFGYTQNQWPQALVEEVDRGLPHNPRRLKSFLASWKLYLAHLAERHPSPALFDWRLTLILNYLGQFEEPLFRRIEEVPGYYSGELLPFCRGRKSLRAEFDGLDLQYGTTVDAAALSGGFESPDAPEGKDDEPQRPTGPRRVFHMSSLVVDLEEVDPATIEQHLLGYPR